MVGAVGNSADVARAGIEQAAGKNPRSIGSLAKAAVAAARDSGADLPKNAQGLAASALARGIDPASFFAARVSDAAPGGVAEDGSATTDALLSESPDPPVREGAHAGNADESDTGEDGIQGGVEPSNVASNSGVPEGDPPLAEESPVPHVDVLLEPVAPVPVNGQSSEGDLVT